MNSIKNQSPAEKTVRVTLDLPVSIVDWVDQVKIEMGFHSRGAVVVRVLKKLCHDSDKEVKETKNKEAY